MGKFDLLLEIIRGVIDTFKLPDNLSVNENKLKIEISPLKKTQPINITINGDIHINTDTPEGIEIAKRIFANSEQLLNKGERAIETDFGKLISDAIPYADTRKQDDILLGQIKPFVPAADMPIVESALFIRRLHKSKVSVDSYKVLLYQMYGSRGNNIANLITAGYYEGYLLPIYEHLTQTEGDQAIPIFHAIYEEAVTQYPFAVFVSRVRGYAIIKTEVENKIKFNLLNEQNILNIHGIGKTNKKTIVSLLKDPDIAKFYLSDPDIVELENTIYARIYF